MDQNQKRPAPLPNYLPGDPVKVNTLRYATVACKLPAGNYVVRYSNGKTEVVSPAVIAWYHRR